MNKGITRISKNAIQLVFDRVVKTYGLQDDSIWDSDINKYHHAFLAVDRDFRNKYSLVSVNREGEFTYFRGGKTLDSKEFYYYLRGMADAKELQNRGL